MQKSPKAVRYGPVPGFPSGTWWGIRMDCSRDLVHEPFNESIHAGPFGAVSICTSHLNPHNDEDLGEILTFTGHECSANNHSKDSLIVSYKNRVPIRLVRSYCLSNSYAPKTGYRYDGLYTVVDHWIGVTSDTTKHNKFVLVRVADQEDPPWAEKMSKTPRAKRSASPRLTRSHSTQEPKAKKKFVYTKVEEEPKVSSVSSIVSREVFKKFISNSPDSSPKSADSPSTCSSSSSSCPTKLCNTNLSIRTNLYDSSHKLQDVKKATMTYCRIIKPVVYHRSTDDESEKMSNTETSDSEVMDKSPSISSTTTDGFADRRLKKVTWADSCDSTSGSIEKSLTAGNGFQYSGSDVVDGFSPTSSKKTTLCNSETEDLPLVEPMASPSPILGLQHVVQVHSSSGIPEISIPAVYETEKSDEPSSSIDSLAPDMLVSMIVKEKYHPMAKLLIGNMIGSENQESDVLSAYNTLLTSKVDQATDSSKQQPPMKNKLRNKFYMRNKTRKNGVLKKPRREIANLMIDAKFDPVTRGSRNCIRTLRSPKKRISKVEIPQRKRRKQPRSINVMEIRREQLQQQQPKKPEKVFQKVNAVVEIRREQKPERREQKPERREQKPEKRKKEEVVVGKKKRPKMCTVVSQCSLLKMPTVDQCTQTGGSWIDAGVLEDSVKVELVDLDEVKSEPCDVEELSDTPSEPDTNYTESNGECCAFFWVICVDFDSMMSFFKFTMFKVM